MPAFIVISECNRLHYLVDGIEKCRPLNPNVSAYISTGKITKSASGYIYEYTIQGEGSKRDGAKSLRSLVSNQLAAFRLAYNIPKEELVNIFFLENPLTENDLIESESWIKVFDKVYCSGRGSDTAFCLYRIIFSYNHDIPTDIQSQIEVETLKRLLDSHKKIVSDNISASSERSFDRHIFYIDNQKCDNAALCLNKEEHDLKMPRFLMDFMMLASNNSDSYKIISAISPATVGTWCFSVGFAESMYYYPDVERYYKYADNRDLHYKFLNAPDETQEDVSKKSMDIEKHPFGLRARKKRLSCSYEDVPFSENIDNYPTTADYKIDESIRTLKDLLIKEREQEIEAFKNSSHEVISCQKRIENYDEQIQNAHQKEGETLEDFDKRIKELCSDKEKIEKELQGIISSFKPNCPEYIDRPEIYNQLCGADNEDKNNLTETLSQQYNDLVYFARDKKFYDFLKKLTNSSSATPEKETATPDDTDPKTETNEELSKNQCWLRRLFSWVCNKKCNKASNKVPSAGPAKINVVSPTVSQQPSLTTNRITCIMEQLDLKSAYNRFKSDIDEVENKYSEENILCKNFTLTEHTNHYCPLIDLEKLKEEHSSASTTRIDAVIEEWKAEPKPTKTSLIEMVKSSVINYTKSKFSFIDWDAPFSFIKEINDEKLSQICNELQKRSAPFVNYNITAMQEENKVTRHLYSDIPEFEKKKESIQANLQNGMAISAIRSTHIASKICMMQFLPMDDEILENLVDLQNESGAD